MARRTIARTATVTGIGLHTGVPTRMSLRPASPGAGRVFRRVDGHQVTEIVASPAAVSDSDRRTVLGAGADGVSTVEHVLAALHGLEIDDVIVEIDGPELPAGDGSALAFVAALDDAGVVELGDAAPAVVAALEVTDGRAHYRVTAHDRLTITVAIDVDHPAVGHQELRLDITPDTFRRELAAARTYGFLADWEILKAEGLARGATRTNTIALTHQDTMVDLRWPNEFVRHKMLDMVGDLALVGSPIHAHIVATQPGHRGNLALARALHDVTAEVIST